MNPFEDIDPGLVSRFVEYDQKNPHVYQAFRERALEMRRTGKKKYSAWIIINIIRWEYDIRTMGDVFQINNDFIALYARKLVDEMPGFVGFFELRTMKARRRKVSQEQVERESDLEAAKTPKSDR